MTLKGRRIALYSHDAMGIGHVRRNLLLARALAGAGATVLLISGVHEACAFEVPPGVDFLNLPALRKESDGTYASRRLGLAPQHLLRLRASTIASALRSLSPDLLVVDKLPLGVGRELLPALRALRDEVGTRCVLGLRDVLDEPQTVQREWAADGGDQAVEQFYDAVWVYGDPAVYDPVRECAFGREVSSRTSYTGYLDPGGAGGGPRLPEAACGSQGIDLRGRKLALCTMGGGEDGVGLAEAFARAALPADTLGVIVTGPFMAREVRRRLREHAAMRHDLRVLEFISEPMDLLACADKVVTMGGYNSVCEALSSSRPTLVVPRVAPRREQSIRAHRLQEMGFLDVLPSAQLTPAGISAWLNRGHVRPAAAAGRIDFLGLTRAPQFAAELLERRPVQAVSVSVNAVPARPEAVEPQRRRNGHAIL